MPLVDVCAVHKYYGDNHVLKGVDLRVESGQVVAIIGRSGSGKSTLLRSINGLESINDGQIVVDDAVLKGSQATPAQPRALRLNVGMVFQQFNLFPHLTAGKTWRFRPWWSRVRRKPRPGSWPARCSPRWAWPRSTTPTPTSSGGGQQQRVAIARALAMQPKVLLCDEITSALDPELVNEVLAVVRQLATEGMTLIMVTHEMRFARDVGDQLVFMHQGRVHECGPARELFAQPRTPELAGFIGAVQ
ncbi:ATP-binding cassette domain-containing protein [Acidovorax citrulli]|nr:ATP-binding cassette domain-containing protein [Paracidovorax citrulli]